MGVRTTSPLFRRSYPASSRGATIQQFLEKAKLRMRDTRRRGSLAGDLQIEDVGTDTHTSPASKLLDMEEEIKSMILGWSCRRRWVVKVYMYIFEPAQVPVKHGWKAIFSVSYGCSCLYQKWATIAYPLGQILPPQTTPMRPLAAKNGTYLRDENCQSLSVKCQCRGDWRLMRRGMVHSLRISPGRAANRTGEPGRADEREGYSWE